MANKVTITRFKTKERLGDYDMYFLPRFGETIIINKENLIVTQVIHSPFGDSGIAIVIVQNKDEHEEELKQRLYKD